jgi:hypothetical protein
VPETRATIIGETALDVEWVFPEHRVLHLIANLGPRAVTHAGPAPDWGRQIHAVGATPGAWRELGPWSVRWYLSGVSP